MNDLGQWLTRFGLGQLEGVLKDNEIDLDVLLDLDPEDLRSLGLPLGPRKRLLKAIAEFAGERAAASADDGNASTQDISLRREHGDGEPDGRRRAAASFFEILVRSIGLIYLKKRVSCAALRQEFGLDDEAFDALRVELVQVERVARDENGEFLVWADPDNGILVDNSENVPRASRNSTPTRSDLASSRLGAQVGGSANGVSHGSRLPGGEAERRQLTVMFCDLAGSTELSTRLDPEDLQDVIHRYQSVCREAIARHDGYIARFLGDGILVYFGFPRARENDAERALRTALEIVPAVQELNVTSFSSQSLDLAVRIGLATGSVVVGDVIGEGASEERSVVGETPNLAARLQGLAKRNGVVASALTKELAGSDFVYQDLGTTKLKGFEESIRAWGVLRKSEPAQGTLSIERQWSSEMVGRREELGLLRRAWAKCCGGAGQVVLISGEPGIGKSRLVDTLGNEIKADGSARTTLRCSPYHANSALYSVIHCLQQILGWQGDDDPGRRLATLQRTLAEFRTLPEDSVQLLAELLSLPLPETQFPALRLSPSQQRQQTLDVLVAWMIEAAEQRPELWVWEDLHWADPSTLELLGSAIDQCPTAPILHVLTFRPDFTPPWPMRSHVTPLTLNRLERVEVESMIRYHSGEMGLPEEVVEHIVTKSDGVPLYVEELTKAIANADFLRRAGERFELTGPIASLAIPATLQDSLMARLDRSPMIREVAQLGAVLGREFGYEVLRALAGMEDPALLESLNQLVEEELLYQRGRPPRARYIFKHALIQDMAYQSLLKRTRQEYHRQVAELLQTRFPELAKTEPELLAHHFSQAGFDSEAIECWQQAGRRASESSAFKEAAGHLTSGLELLGRQPDSEERQRRELPLQTALGTALLIVKGHAAPDVEATYKRARHLCHSLGDTANLPPVLLGLWRVHFTRSDIDSANDTSGEILDLLGKRDDPTLYVMAHYAMGVTCFARGDLQQALEHFELGIDRAAATRGDMALIPTAHDPGLGCRVFSACVLWLLGRPGQSNARASEAVEMAIELDHPITGAFVLTHAAQEAQFRGNSEEVEQYANAAAVIATEQGFTTWRQLSLMLHGWALAKRGDRREGMSQMKDALAGWRAGGALFQVPHQLDLLAEVDGRVEPGLETLREALDIADQTGQTWWLAELHRRYGELLLRRTSPQTTEAESHFEQAIQVARQQQAGSLELRAATSLAKLRRDANEIDAARALLEPACAKIAAGLAGADLIEAKALLDELA